MFERRLYYHIDWALLLAILALCAFGVVLALLVVRTGRLGTAVVAHMAFNGVSVIYLLHYR